MCCAYTSLPCEGPPLVRLCCQATKSPPWPSATAAGFSWYASMQLHTGIGPRTALPSAPTRRILIEGGGPARGWTMYAPPFRSGATTGGLLGAGSICLPSGPVQFWASALVANSSAARIQLDDRRAATKLMMTPSEHRLDAAVAGRD